ncbi:sensor histidine kinase, partial [Lacticaseibacillus yichunensis]
MTEQRQTGYSINRYIRFLMGGLLLLGVLNIVLLVVTVHYSRAERVRRLENTISIYLEDVSTRFKAIDHFMVYSTVNDPNLKKLAGLSPTTDIAAMIKPLDGFRQRVSDQQYSTGTAYQFYYFSSKTGYFTNVSPLQVDYEDYGKIQSQLVDGWATKTTIIAEPWKPIVVSGKYYLYHEVRYQDTVLFCVVAVSALTGPIQNDYLTPQDFAYLRLDGQDLIKGKHPALVKSGTRYMKTTDRARTLPFSFNVQLDQYSQTEKFTVLQIILVILTTIIGGGAIFAVIYLWRNFAIPLREFSSAVKMMTADPDGPNLDASRIKELENVNEQFHTLMTQVRSLKLSLYENEIQQKKSQIQFMQLQIRPHFYLNILTTLFSMIQMNEMDHMSDLIMSATKYMRLDYSPRYLGHEIASGRSESNVWSVA